MKNKRLYACKIAIVFFLSFGLSRIVQITFKPLILRFLDKIAAYPFGDNWFWSIWNLFFYSLTLTFILVFFGRQLKEECLLFFREKKKKRTLKLLQLIPYWLADWVCSAVCAIIIYTLTQTEALNEASLDLLYNTGNIWTRSIEIILSVIFAPIVEEVTLRFGIFRILREKGRIIAYVISSLIFGFLHVFDFVVTGEYLQLLYVIPYGVSGFFYARYYDKCDNLCYPVLLHAFNNIIAYIF